ncbi:MAG TPA: AAA domain-containing protein [Puia sp.]|nr:AAA domain-containing protein [Puia sp.]
METNQTRFASFLPTAFDRGNYATDDVIAFVGPLFRKVLRLHEEGKVAPFEKEGALFVTSLVLDIDTDQAHLPSDAIHKVLSFFPQRQPHFDIQADSNASLLSSSSVWLPGYQCFEEKAGHHDPQTDIFCLGLVLGSMALGLDLYDPGDMQQFAKVRTNPSLHRPSIHPTLGGLITEMTEPDRRRRTQDLYDVIRRLDHYRDYDPDRQIDLGAVPGWIDKGSKERNTLILNRLRNRLFDTSRRNRLLYYKPNKRLVNLTISSVPMVLHYQSIRPELLFTWNEELAEKITGMKEIVLNKYLRFEDHEYLSSSLDKVRLESQRAIQEYGFSQLRLVIAFLSWHNLKEDPAERIQSPLLLVPVSLKKNKRLKEDHYILKPLDNTAEVNPVLANQLKELYGFRLPDLIDLEEMTPEQFAQQVKAQIDKANQGISLRYIGKPRLRLIHTEARQTVNKYGKRPAPYRPDPGEYVPVELRIFRQQKQERTLFLKSLPRSLANAAPRSEIPEASPTLRYETPVTAGNPPPSDIPVTGGDPPLYEMMTSDINPYSWDFDACNMVLGNFNYKKMSLVRDYNRVIDQQLQHHVFDALFSNQPRVFAEHSFDLNRPDDWHHVITADPTQTKAVLQSRAGYSYIIQGPPGTGKSQTITNLIADFVARGKNILFVCEKRAALDVVYHRLKQVGLDELCCYIHDSQSDKREFVRNLKASYEEFTLPGQDPNRIRQDRQLLLDKMNAGLDTIREYQSISCTINDGAGVEVRHLIEKIISLRQELVTLTALHEEALPSYIEWTGSRPAIAVLEEALQANGVDPVFAEHPFSRLHESIFLSDSPSRVLKENLQQALLLLDEVQAGLLRSGAATGQAANPDQIKALIQFAVLLYPLVRSGHPELADPDDPATKTLEREIVQYRQLQQAHLLSLERNIHWRRKLDQQDLDNALSLATRKERAFFGFLDGNWQRLKKRLQQDYDLKAHSVKPSYAGILGLLDAEYKAAERVDQARRQIQEKYGMDSIDTAWLSLETLHNKKDHPGLLYLLQNPMAGSMIAALNGLHQPFGRLETQLRRCLHEPAAGELSTIRDELRTIHANTDGLVDLLPALRSFTTFPDSVKETLRNLPLRTKQIEAAIAWKSLKELYQSNRTFRDIDLQRLATATQQWGEGYDALLRANADYIRAFIRQRFLRHMDLANMAAGQLNEEQKTFKKIYNEGRKILENEFGKSMRYKSIRELSAKESGRVLKDIKPIWLMSPYSVSDSLPMDLDHFDVVIFDEASQIALEEGVPALYRSRQVIVVGDEKQMPPTDFFHAGSKDSDPDDLGSPDGEEEEWWSNDADSLLAQGARHLDSVLLSWHYRSRFETLISFSNQAFYEGKLLTIPDKTIHHREKTPIRITAPEEAEANVLSIFDRSISYHYHPQGLYEKRSNKAEAAYIARLVRELYRRDTKESLGIVAFSQEQQHAIETALDELAGQDAVFAQQLEEAYIRTENDQFTGLIVKNLENIQGDERDIIIMSVCYGFDNRKKMLMNFGPVNKRGGEKRLNVLFSRARMHTAVVSSIRHEHITNEYNDGANYLRRFLQYAERVSMGRMKEARTILDGLTLPKETTGRRITPTVIRQQLRQQIEALGHEVAEQVGQSDFKCSLAVKARPEDTQYALGILLDDDEHYRNKNLVEQYCQRPAILRAFGWQIIAVFAKDWLHQPQKVMEQITRALAVVDNAGMQHGYSATRPGSGDLPSLLPGQDGPSTKSPTTFDHLVFHRLQAAAKFWEVAIEDNTLIQRWGTTGARGQIQVKTFPDGEAAQKEMDEMISEKLKTGYAKV